MDVQAAINEAYGRGHSDGMLAQKWFYELASKVTEPVTAQQVDEALERGAAATSEPAHSLITVSQLINVLGDYVKAVDRYNESIGVVIADLRRLSRGLLATEQDARDLLELCPAGALRWRWACEDNTHSTCVPGEE